MKAHAAATPATPRAGPEHRGLFAL